MTEMLSLLGPALLLLCASCGVSRPPCYQVYNVTPTSYATTVGTKMMMEHDSLRCWYDLWSDGGNSGIELENGSSRSVVLLNSVSHFTLNGIHYPFYDREQAALCDSLTRDAQERGLDTVFSPDHPPITIIPPYSSVYLDGFTINCLYLDDSSLRARPDRPDRRKRGRVLSLSFDREESPFLFSNTLWYLVGSDTVPRRLEDGFYVSQVTNLTQDQLYEQVHPLREDGTADLGQWLYLCPSATPNRFYVPYDPDDTPGNYGTVALVYLGVLFVGFSFLFMMQGG